MLVDLGAQILRTRFTMGSSSLLNWLVQFRGDETGGLDWLKCMGAICCLAL